MPTPVSSSTPYCTPTILLQYYDARQIGDLLLDTTPGQRASSQAISAGDPRVENALAWASGEIEAACLVAGKYAVADLQALTGMSLANLQGLCATLAFWKLVCRRYPKAEMPDDVKWAFEKLERLRSGERIFGLQDQIDAGTEVIEQETLPDIFERNLTTTQASRFFGQRADVRRAWDAQYG
jgi:hypothetical protein